MEEEAEQKKKWKSCKMFGTLNGFPRRGGRKRKCLTLQRVTMFHLACLKLPSRLISVYTWRTTVSLNGGLFPKDGGVNGGREVEWSANAFSTPSRCILIFFVFCCLAGHGLLLDACWNLLLLCSWNGGSFTTNGSNISQFVHNVHNHFLLLLSPAMLSLSFHPFHVPLYRSVRLAVYFVRFLSVFISVVVVVVDVDASLPQLVIFLAQLITKSFR